MVDKMITNFHSPKSTLMMMVGAFAGRKLIMKAYKEANITIDFLVMEML